MAVVVAAASDLVVVFVGCWTVMMERRKRVDRRPAWRRNLGSIRRSDPYPYFQ